MWSICCPVNVRRPCKRQPNYRWSIQRQRDEYRKRWPLGVLRCGHVALDVVLVLVFPCAQRTIESKQMVVWPCAAFRRLVLVALDVYRLPVLPSIRPHKRPKIERNRRRTPKRRQTNRCAVDLDGKTPNRSWPHHSPLSVRWRSVSNSNCARSAATLERDDFSNCTHATLCCICSAWCRCWAPWRARPSQTSHSNSSDCSRALCPDGVDYAWTCCWCHRQMSDRTSWCWALGPDRCWWLRAVRTCSRRTKRTCDPKICSDFHLPRLASPPAHRLVGSCTNSIRLAWHRRWCECRRSWNAAAPRRIQFGRYSAEPVFCIRQWFLRRSTFSIQLWAVCSIDVLQWDFPCTNLGISNTEPSNIAAPNSCSMYMSHRFPCYCHNCIFHPSRGRRCRRGPGKILFFFFSTNPWKSH